MKGRWYPGKIARERADGTFDIDYDDGEKEYRVEDRLVRALEERDAETPAPELRVSDRVEGNYRGAGRYYPGRITRVNAGGTVNIDYDDGESERYVEKSMVRPVGSSPKKQVSAGGLASPRRLREGDKIEGNYRSKGRWYAGKIKRENNDGTFDIDYDDGEKEYRVEARLVRAVDDSAGGPSSPKKSSGPPREGEPCEANGCRRPGGVMASR